MSRSDPQKSDTPRVDDQIIGIRWRYGNYYLTKPNLDSFDSVPADFARTLERELNAHADAVKLAVEALESCKSGTYRSDPWSDYDEEKVAAALAALRALNADATAVPAAAAERKGENMKLTTLYVLAIVSFIISFIPDDVLYRLGWDAVTFLFLVWFFFAPFPKHYRHD